MFGLSWYLVELYIPTKYSKQIVSTNEVDSATFILVFGSGRSEVNARPNQSFEFRLAKTIEVFDAFPMAKIIVSGIDVEPLYTETQTMKDSLIKHGIPSSSIIIDSTSASTCESIEYVNKIVHEKRIIFISQKEHLFRALFLASCTSMKVHGIAAHQIDDPYHTYFLKRERQARFMNLFSCLPKMLFK